MGTRTGLTASRAGLTAPRVVGILNVTPDSFSDGGLWLDPSRATARAWALWRDGADIVELGGASSRPGAEPVSAQEEWARIEPVLTLLRGETHRLGVDSSTPEVLTQALSRGVAMVNDVSGFGVRALWPTLARSKVRLVLMHRVSAPDVRVGDIYARARDFLIRRRGELARAGIASSRVVIDPGWGLFLSRDPEASWTMLRRLGALRQEAGAPVMAAVSRKGFLAADPSQRASAGLAAEVLAALAGADWIRTHEPGALRGALDALDAFRSAPSRSAPSRSAPGADTFGDIS